MLGIKFKADEEQRFELHARKLRRPKSALAREWILERLDRESIDADIARAAAIIAAETNANDMDWHRRNTDEMLRRLDEEDGGYDWGPSGPPL